MTCPSTKSDSAHAIVIRSCSAYSIRDRSNALHIKSGCMAAIFTFLKSPNESLAKVGVHVLPGFKTTVYTTYSVFP